MPGDLSRIIAEASGAAKRGANGNLCDTNVRTIARCRDSAYKGQPPEAVLLLLCTIATGLVDPSCPGRILAGTS